PSPTPTYTLSLHDALPISRRSVDREVALFAGHAAEPESVPAEPHGEAAHRARSGGPAHHRRAQHLFRRHGARLRSGHRQPVHATDRKSTRLNSSHLGISYA